MAKHVKKVVLFDSNPKAADKTAAEAHGIDIHSYEEVITIGKIFQEKSKQCLPRSSIVFLVHQSQNLLKNTISTSSAILQARPAIRKVWNHLIGNWYLHAYVLRKFSNSIQMMYLFLTYPHLMSLTNFCSLQLSCLAQKSATIKVIHWNFWKIALNCIQQYSPQYPVFTTKSTAESKDNSRRLQVARNGWSMQLCLQKAIILMTAHPELTNVMTHSFLRRLQHCLEVKSD